VINFLIWIVLGVLVIASIFDIKYKAIPSVLLTGTIFIALMLRPDNLLFGVIAFVFALIIKDLMSDVAGMEFGVADVKIIIVIGLLLANFFSLILMIIMFIVFQFVYTFIWRLRINKEDEMAFVPCLLAVYVALILIGGVL